MKKTQSSIKNFLSFQLKNKQTILIKGGTTSTTISSCPKEKETPSGGSGVGGTLNEPPTEG